MPEKKYPDKIVLLLGNHDIHYLYFPRYQCVGFRSSMQRQLTNLFYQNRHLFQIAYQKENYFFTHAGITNSWYSEFLKLPILAEIEDEKDTLANLINKVDQTRHRYILHTAGYFRGGRGNGGVTWADIKETQIDMLKGYHQIVGHSTVEKVKSIRYTDYSITYIDVLDQTGWATVHLIGLFEGREWHILIKLVIKLMKKTNSTNL
ncbi:MAG: metallophosphoesterase [Mucilaginibacter sp.]|nr:metallophosphoesterase [Mucilaginibacter sp.]